MDMSYPNQPAPGWARALYSIENGNSSVDDLHPRRRQALIRHGLLDSDGKLTVAGYELMEQYRESEVAPQALGAARPALSALRDLVLSAIAAPDGERLALLVEAVRRLNELIELADE